MPPGDIDRELKQVAESLVLADRMFRKGKIAEAEPMYERTLAMLIRTYAEAHPDVDACLLRLGDIYFQREKFAQALSTYLRLHGLRSRTMSIHNVDTIAISFKIAKCQEKLEQVEDAARTYHEAIGLGEQWLQPGLPLVGSMMESYAILLRKSLNEPQRAAEMEHRAKEYRKRYTGPKGTASRLPHVSGNALPFAPSDLTRGASPNHARAPEQNFEEDEPSAPVPIRDESALETDYDEEDEKPASKNFLLVAFIVLVAVVVPVSIGWMMMQKHPQAEVSQPTPSFGATTMPASTPSLNATIAPATEPSSGATTAPATEPSSNATTAPTERRSNAITEPATKRRSNAVTEPATERRSNAITAPATERRSNAITAPATAPSAESSIPLPTAPHRTVTGAPAPSLNSRSAETVLPPKPPLKRAVDKSAPRVRQSSKKPAPAPVSGVWSDIYKAREKYTQ